MQAMTTLLLFLALTWNTASTKDKCAVTVNMGQADVCLPNVEGMTECYANPQVKELADMTEAPGNSVLAYYLTDAQYNNLEESMQTGFNDYFKFYVLNTIREQEITAETAEMVFGQMQGTFVDDQWERIDEELDNQFPNMTIGQPKVVDHYKPSSNSKSFVMFVKYQTEAGASNICLSMNLIHVKNRIVFMAYYKSYEGEETVKIVKEKSNGIIQSLNELNS